MLINAYTDGSAVVVGKRKGDGGFATYFPDLFGKKKVYSLGFKNTKTGRMEITALLYAIKAIPLSKELTLKVYSDSEYIVKSFTENRLERWVINNWVSWGKPVKNVDLWKKVLFEIKKRPKMTLVLEHIKSHQLDKIKNRVQRQKLLQNKHIVGNYIADKFADYKRFTNFKIDINEKTN